LILDESSQYQDVLFRCSDQLDGLGVILTNLLRHEPMLSDVTIYLFNLIYDCHGHPGHASNRYGSIFEFVVFIHLGLGDLTWDRKESPAWADRLRQGF
jgi:hypothetical protein